MFIAILTLLSALSISGVAIFYSVIGLATIFPGAFVPVVIMGSVLEVGKLIAASWLYRNWKHTRFILKTYLTVAVVVLSIITSMGIFGFLSKAHLEQNLASENLTQRIELINSKITSQQTYILRQNAVIERAEKSLTRTTGSNTEAIEIEKQSLKDVQDKFKTLLTVETNTIKNLNDRLKILDKDVSDVLTTNKSFFNEEKAAADLKTSQKEEREAIQTNTSEAQDRIAILKSDYANDTDAIQKRIDNLREGTVDDKSDVNVQIEKAEDNIINSQNTIDDLIIERGPLEQSMIKLEAEVGPVKYIAALVVDWGVTDKVELNEAVRWVILLIIVVFDPLAVALLLAANQSLMRRFPVEPLPPEEVLDLEKPDDEDVTLKWNEMMAKKQKNTMEQATTQLKDWKDKLEAFNKKVPKPEDKPVKIVQKKTDAEEIDAHYKDPADVIKAIKREEEAEAKKEQLERFRQREQEERENLERISREAKEDELKEMAKQWPEYTLEELKKEQELADYTEKFKEKDGFDEDQIKYDIETPTKTEPKTATVEEALKMPESESVETPIAEQIEKVMEPERTRPDFTEVLEPEVAVVPKTGIIGQRVVEEKTGKVVEKPKPDPATMTDFERTGMLNKLHQEHGKFEDVSDEELKKDRDDANKAQFLADVSLDKEEAEAHTPITESRMAFFQDIIDDILRGNTTFENIPEDVRKTVAQIMDDELPNPQIITKGSALKEEHPEGIEEMSPEGLKEKFMIAPKTEERPMTDEELDKLLEGWDQERQPRGVADKPKDDYVQNEEQDDTTLWNKTQELDLPEPEKNEIILPDLQTTAKEDIPEIAEKITIDSIIPKHKFERYKKRVTTDTDYHSRIEQRINDLITKLENDELKLKNLTDEDQKVILDILNQE